MKDDDPSAGGEGSSVVKLRTQDRNDDGSVFMQIGSLVDDDRAVWIQEKPFHLSCSQLCSE